MDRLFELGSEFWIAAAETLYMVALTLFFGGSSAWSSASCSTRPGRAA